MQNTLIETIIERQKRIMHELRDQNRTDHVGGHRSTLDRSGEETVAAQLMNLMQRKLLDCFDHMQK